VRAPLSTRRAMLGLVLALAAGLLGCDSTAPVDERPVVAVSVVPLAGFVEELVGGQVDIAVMLPPGASPASYEPSIQQVRDLESASLYVGLGHPSFPFERAWLSKLVSGREGLTVISVLEPTADDPHGWLDPAQAIRISDQIAAALVILLPNEADAIEARRSARALEIAALDAELKEILAPISGRRFLVFHPAWGAFADRYGLVQVAIERDHKEPDPHMLSEVMKEARAAEARVIFVQPQFSRLAAETIADEIGARVETLDPMARDWDANLRNAAKQIAEAAR